MKATLTLLFALLFVFPFTKIMAINPNGALPASLDTLPPPGNLCTEAPILCAGFDTLSGTLPAVNIPQAFPKCPSNVLNNTAWYAFVAGTSSISFLVTPSNCQGTNGQFGMQGGIYSGCDGPAMALQCTCTNAPFTLEANNYVPGTIYFLVLDGCAGDVCDFTVEVLSGSTVPPADLQTNISGTTAFPDTSGSYAGVYTATGGDFFQWSIEPPDAGTFLNGSIGDTVEILWQEPGNAATAKLCVTPANFCTMGAQVCQTISLDTLPEIPDYEVGFIAEANFIQLNSTLTGLCPGDTIFLTGFTLLDGDTVMNDSGFVYQWTFDENETAEGKTVAFVFNSPGFHQVELTVTFSPGHEAVAIPFENILIIETPAVTVTGLPAGPFCPGTEITLSTEPVSDTIILSGTVSMVENFPDGLPIPDGNGISVEIPIALNGVPGSVLTSLDSLRICINMEHSWLRDLEIKITCPNGQSAILHNHPGQTGGEVFLGVPYESDEGQTPVPGIGYDYCWTANAPNPTWIQYANSNIPSTLPAGDYSSFEPLTNLLGCPLDGDWILSITDWWAIDNGMVFSAGVTIADSAQLILILDASPQWQPDNSITGYTPEAITAVPDSTTTYVLDVSSSYGCGYQLEFPVEVLPADDAACLPCDSLTVSLEDVLLTCENILPQTVTASISVSGDFMKYCWLFNGDTIAVSTEIEIVMPGEYIFIATNTASGCAVADTLNFIVDIEAPIADAGPDQSILCHAELDGSASSSGPEFSYAWYFQDNTLISTENVASVTEPGLYTLIVTNNSNGCTASDEVAVVEVIVFINGFSTPDSCGLGLGAAMVTVSAPGAGYLWSTGDTTATVTGLFAGLYFVTVTLQDCVSNLAISVDSVICTDAAEQLPGVTQLVISPNPNTGQFTVQFSLTERTKLEFSLLDVAGRTISLLAPSENLTEGQHTLHFEQSHLPDGSYYLKIKSPNGQGVWKVVKMK